MFYRFRILPFLGSMLVFGLAVGLALGSATLVYRSLTDGRKQEKTHQYVSSISPEYNA